MDENFDPNVSFVYIPCPGVNPLLGSGSLHREPNALPF